MTTRDTLKVGCVQLCSTGDPIRNAADASALVREAVAKGAELVILPEVSNLCQKDKEKAFATSVPEEEDPFLSAMRGLAQETGVWIHIGSAVVTPDDGDGRLANRGYLIDPTGAIKARYDKIHMFDVDLANGDSYRESKSYRPGEEAVLADTPWGGYGMTICYDVRFPHLYRTLAQAGARIIAVPAAFTKPTGEAHWHVLLRARAIENGAFVISAAQGGKHEDGRETYGHSIVISPWGEVLAEAGEGPGVIVADLDLGRVERVRGQVPSLRNGREFRKPAPIADRAAAE